MRAQEEANFLRRLAVIDRIRQIAVESNDEAMERQADTLQAKAQKVFKERCEAIAAGRDLVRVDAREVKK